ncbi:hypothetical protein [Streptomyces sp. NPDC001401]|uniref:hypothetical protein n=1 Tax=Streptomyces sp. NPDC001401 TaxID=3364570 RepID=UPI0036980138
MRARAVVADPLAGLGARGSGGRSGLSVRYADAVCAVLPACTRRRYDHEHPVGSLLRSAA